MANPAVLKQFQKALGRWPQDILRPHANFTDVMQKRIASKPPSEAETNALFTLLENRYSRKYPLSKSTTSPASDPEHYGRLLEELEEAPERTGLQRFMKRITGLVRWK